MIKSILPLTTMEKVMIYSYMTEKEHQSYFEQLSFLLSGKVNVDLFIKAYEFICADYASLRAIYRFNNIEQPVKLILDEAKLDYQLHDISDSTNREKSIEEWEREEKLRYFDIEKKPPHRLSIFKIDDESYKVFFSFHHILLDGWSLANVIKSWLTAYECLSEKVDPPRVHINEKDLPICLTPVIKPAKMRA